NSEQPIQIYNRAAADLAAELPELNNGRNGFESLTTQDRTTGEIYQLQLSSPERGEYPSTYFQEFVDAQKLKPRRGEPVVVRSGLGGTLVGVHRSVPPGSPPPRLEPVKGYRIPVTSIIEFVRQ